MGKYKYENRKLKHIVLLYLIGNISVVSALIIMYLYPGDRGFFSLIPPAMRFYAFVAGLGLIAVISYIGYRRMSAGPKIDGDVSIEDGKLQLKVHCENRLGIVELDVKTLTLIENDDERLRIGCAKGEYVFNPSGFELLQAYEKFRMELTCEKYKK